MLLRLIGASIEAIIGRPPGELPAPLKIFVLVLQASNIRASACTGRGPIDGWRRDQSCHTAVVELARPELFCLCRYRSRYGGGRHVRPPTEELPCQVHRS